MRVSKASKQLLEGRGGKARSIALRLEVSNTQKQPQQSPQLKCVMRSASGNVSEAHDEDASPHSCYMGRPGLYACGQSPDARVNAA